MSKRSVSDFHTRRMESYIALKTARNAQTHRRKSFLINVPIIWQKVVLPILHVAIQRQWQETQCKMAPRRLVSRPLALMTTKLPTQSCGWLVLPQRIIIDSCDDGSDDSIVSPRAAAKAVLEDRGRMQAINLVMVQVALCQGQTPHKTTSRSWTSPRRVLKLASGKLAILNVSILFADDNLSCENMLVGYPALLHSRIYDETLPESIGLALNGIDCQSVDNQTVNTGRNDRVMISRTMCVKRGTCVYGVDCAQRSSQLSQVRLRVHYKESRQDLYSFSDLFLLDQLHSTNITTLKKRLRKIFKLHVKIVSRKTIGIPSHS